MDGLSSCQGGREKLFVVLDFSRRWLRLIPKEVIEGWKRLASPFFGGSVMIEVTDVGLTEAEGLCVSIPG
jgi:hypothetical protein